MASKGSTATLKIDLYDGARRPLTGVETLITVRDGFQKQMLREFFQASTILCRVPFQNNLGDNYAVLADAGGHHPAGFHPVKAVRNAVQTVDLMLLPEGATYNFQAARWDVLRQTHPRLAGLLAGGAASDAAAEDRYTQLIEQRPPVLAALLNITAALSQIFLSTGTPLDYCKELIWDDSMKEDRVFGYADQNLLNQVRLAARARLFAREPKPGSFHPGATESYKQVQFGEANVQITFHGNDTRTIDGASCFKVELDMDYYKDLGAHALLEVLPNWISGSRTDPRKVYVLRWMAGRRAGVPEFNPPYVIS